MSAYYVLFMSAYYVLFMSKNLPFGIEAMSGCSSAAMFYFLQCE